MKEEQIHKPVLLKEVIDLLVLNRSGFYFEGTSGFGGHTRAILDLLNDDALFIGVDKDKVAYDYLKSKFKDEDRIRLYNASFTEIKTICKIESINKLDGILLDLGVSSFQLDNTEAGFSYRFDGVLDMRMDKTQVLTAADLINSKSVEELSKIFYEFGEEKFSKKIAHEIVEHRSKTPIRNASELKIIIKKVVGERFLNKSLSRIFQALRIAVNNELDELSRFLDYAIDLLAPSGRIAVISFHSLEDRIVKEKFRFESLDCICPPNIPQCVCNKKRRLKILTKKPVTASNEELASNTRARSAKLRVAERL